ncbi:hypothetical protein ACHWQZ_G005843 [Mnemiopsis leidyi]
MSETDLEELAWLKYENICDEICMRDMTSTIKIMIKSDSTVMDWNCLELVPMIETFHDCKHLMQYMLELETNLKDFSVRNLDSTFVNNSWQCLTRNFRNVELVSKTLSNILSVTKLASHDDRQECPDISVFLAAVLSIGLHQANDKEFGPEVEDCLQKVILILSEISSVYDKKSKAFWSMDYNCPYSANTMVSFIILLPKIVPHFEYRCEKIEDLLTIFRKCLKDVSENYNSSSQASVISHLSKQGFIRKLLHFIKDFTRGNLEHCPYSHFERLIDCVLFLLKSGFNSKEFLPILPDLCFLLSKTNISLEASQVVSDKSIILVINVLIERAIDDCSNNIDSKLTCEESFDNLLESLKVNGEICHHIAGMITGLIKALKTWNLNNICESKTDQSLLNSRLHKLAMKVESLIDLNIGSQKSSLSLFQLYSFSISSRLPDHKSTESSSTWSANDDVMMFFTLLKISMILLNRKDLIPQRDPLLNLLVNKPFLSVTQLEGELSKSMSCLTEIVTNNLPELASQFKGPYSPDYLLFVTKIMVLMMDVMDDLFDPRWDQVRSIMSSFYKELSGNDDIAIRTTRLVFMWKLFQMDLNNTFVSSLIMYDCKNEDADEICLTDLNDSLSQEMVHKVREIFFSKIVQDLKQLLKENHSKSSEDEIIIQCLTKISGFMAKMSQSCLAKHQFAMLGELVYTALDISDVYSECNKVISENVDTFIRNIYLR